MPSSFATPRGRTNAKFVVKTSFHAVHAVVADITDSIWFEGYAYHWYRR